MSMIFWFTASWIIVSILVALGMGKLMRESAPEEMERATELLPTRLRFHAHSR